MREPGRARLPAAALLVLLLVTSAPGTLDAADRVPRPQFTSDYVEPTTQNPAPRSIQLEYLDVAVLGACLVLSGWLAIRARSREGIFLMSLFSIAYFGFFRKGCICPIGAIQNVALALADPSYAIPVVAVAFFALPLVSALLAGRTFCAGVCPFGALQDALVVKPLRLPRWLAVPLGFLPVAYLGLAVLFAATGAEFIVCRFDPFVNFFRPAGGVEILAFGAGFVLLGTVVARPYCRFLCPYGVILRWLSRLSVWHARIAPDSCMQCRLCEESCPVDAIRSADPQGPSPGSAATAAEKRGLAAAIVAVPLLAALGAFAGWELSPLLARVHPKVRLEIQVLREQADSSIAHTLESDAFYGTETTVGELTAAADAVRRRFAIGGPVLGGFVMLAAAFGLVATYPRRRREEYEPDRAECVSCGRCFSHCPREHLRLKERSS